MAKKQKMEENASLLNVISPIALKFESNNFILGENYCKGYGVIKYPPAPNYGWLTRITNIPLLLRPTKGKSWRVLTRI